MNVYVKIKGTDQPCGIPSIRKILSVNAADEVSEITDFKSLHIYANKYYVFIGDRTLHVYGQNIEFVLFQ